VGEDQLRLLEFLMNDLFGQHARDDAPDQEDSIKDDANQKGRRTTAWFGK